VANQRVIEVFGDLEHTLLDFIRKHQITPDEYGLVTVSAARSRCSRPVVSRALGRHFFRPAHLHVKVSAPGHETLTSQLYFTGDQYLESDAANAVRDGLVISLERTQAGYLATYDFVLEANRMPTSS